MAPLRGDMPTVLEALRNRALHRDDVCDSVVDFGFYLTTFLIEEELINPKNVYAVILLRAGLSLWIGSRSLIDSDVGFIDVKRDHDTLEPVLGVYKCAPDLSDKTVIVFDVMLATGGSAGAAIDAIKSKPVKGPDHIILLTLISAPEGIAYIETHHPDVTIVTAVIDDGLDDNGYIVPGLGDAGDRLFGPIE